MWPSQVRICAQRASGPLMPRISLKSRSGLFSFNPLMSRLQTSIPIEEVAKKLFVTQLTAGAWKRHFVAVNPRADAMGIRRRDELPNLSDQVVIGLHDALQLVLNSIMLGKF